MTVTSARVRTSRTAPALHEPGNPVRIAATAARPRIAYLTNVYPKISHSFIRTEIEALEREGFTVDRFTVRRSTDALIDREERAEQRRTVALLDRNRINLALATAWRFARRPIGTARALGTAFHATCGQGWNILNVERALAYFGEAAALAEKMERSGIRHVHVHFGTNPATVARLASRMASITYSFTAHGPDEFDGPVAHDLTGKIAEAAFVVGVSHFGRGQLMRWSKPRHWDRIHVVRCSIAERFLSVPASHDLRRRLVCVARLNAQKGLPLLIEAVGRLASEPHFTLTIVGDGEERAAIEAQIARLGLNERVLLLGWCSPQDVLREIARARVFVLPSFAEGLPVVLMEALALGRPVIATAVAGVPELVDSTNGWLVPAGSAEALAEALREALDAPEERLRAMGEVGRTRVHADHHPAQNARLLAGLLAPLA